MDSLFRHPVRNENVPRLIGLTLLSPSALAAVLRYLWIVSRYFFLPQWFARVFPRWSPLVSVDDSLDERVPFRPDKVDIYLDFIGVWVRASAYLRRRLGRKGIPDFVEFLDGLSEHYRSAYRVYRRTISTTRRPRRAANSRFAVIYFTDPHFFCVPSLHVIIVCYAFLKAAEIFGRRGLRDEEQSAIDDIYEQAVAITETVLYVKQHSVNCIPAAFYMVSRAHPSFGREEVRIFVERLFRNAQDVPEAEAIRVRIMDLYDRFMEEGLRLPADRDYRDVLVDFLKGFPSVRK